MSDKHNEKAPIDEELAKKYDEYFEEHGVLIGSYYSDQVAMALVSQDIETGARQDLTVNLGSNYTKTYDDRTIIPKYCAFLDTKNYPDLDKYLEADGWGKPYTRDGKPVTKTDKYFDEYLTKKDGTFEYPLFQFDVEVLKEIDPIGLKQYEENYDTTIPRLQRTMNDLMNDPMYSDLFNAEDDVQDDGTGLGE